MDQTSVLYHGAPLRPVNQRLPNVCNRQVQSAFTSVLDTDIPSKGTGPFTPMGDITVDPKGVQMSGDRQMLP